MIKIIIFLGLLYACSAVRDIQPIQTLTKPHMLNELPPIEPRPVANSPADSSLPDYPDKGIEDAVFMPAPEQPIPLMEDNEAPDDMENQNDFVNCMIAGCNNQICVDRETAYNIGMTTCDWKLEYACLQYTSCRVQAHGKCGWTKTPAYVACLASNVQNTPDPAQTIPPPYDIPQGYKEPAPSIGDDQTPSEERDSVETCCNEFPFIKEQITTVNNTLYSNVSRLDTKINKVENECRDRQEDLDLRFSELQEMLEDQKNAYDLALDRLNAKILNLERKLSRATDRIEELESQVGVNFPTDDLSSPYRNEELYSEEEPY